MKEYLAQRRTEFDLISDGHRLQLNELASLVQELRASDGIARLNFICTHNSRRSQFSQVWASIAAAKLGLDDIECFSGGTEVTACNPRTVAALQRSGVPLIQKTEGDNPLYSASSDSMAIECSSKLYDEPPNPASGYIAVMTCGNADKACQTVNGAAHRIVLRFDDPKVSDDTPEESRTYDDRCAQIAREMLYLMETVAESGH